MDFLNSIADLISVLNQGISSFVKFIIDLPSLFYNLIDLIPSPFDIVILSFISFLLIVLIFKVVRLIVG
ncbi:MAG: hypothetical protein Q4E75_00685 [bacterium]|nr:hypothetical protein [bacterium]